MEGIRGRRVQCSESWGWDCYHHSGADKTGTIITLERIRPKHSFRLGFRASNNETKYEALLAGLRAVMDIGAREWRFTWIPNCWLVRYRAVLKLEIPE